MEDKSKDFKNVAKTISQDEIDNTAEIGQNATELSCNTITAENVHQKEGVQDMPSTSKDYTLKDKVEYRDTGFDDSDDCADVEQKYAASRSFPHRRTYSASDSPVDNIPQLKIYDSDAKIKDKKQIGEYEKKLRKFQDVSAAWRKIRGQLKPKLEQREIKSDGELANIMTYCSKITKTNFSLSDLSLNNQTFGADLKTETFSEISRLIDFKEKLKSSLENTSGIETSCSSIMSEESDGTHVINLNTQSGNVSNLNISHNSELTNVTEGGKLKPVPDHNLGLEDTQSSDSSEISRIIEAGKTMSPEFIECYSTSSEIMSSSDNSHVSSADIEKNKSPPKITAEPPSADSGIFKVPSKRKCSTSTDESFSPKPKSLSAPSSITRQRPTDFNVNARSAFYTFNINSPTGLVLRPYRSLPNVNRPNRYNFIRRSMNLNCLTNQIARSLFTGDCNTNRQNLRNRSTSVNENKCSSGKRDVTELLKSRTDPETSSKASANDACSEAYQKTIVASKKETNENKILQEENLSADLIGGLSDLRLLDSIAPPVADSSARDASPKRSVNSKSTECSPAKKARASCEFDIKQTSVKENQEKLLCTRDLLKPQSASAKTKVSPKRKSEDVETWKPGIKSSNEPTKHESSKSTVKKTKVKEQTPEGEIDASDEKPESDKIPELDKMPGLEEDKK